MSGSERISPTAYATGYLWYRHGLSHPGLLLPEGKRLDRAWRILTGLTRVFSGVSLDALMLARHKGIDARLAAAIEDGRIGQVIEIAAGLSPRGWRFKRRFGDRITYVETDLPAMAATKRELLLRGGLLTAGHRVVELDALAGGGERALAAVAGSLDPARGTAIITEGLMNYLEPAAARGVWSRIAAALRPFPAGIYLSDMYINREPSGAALKAFYALLQAFVRGRMHVHFESELHAVELMRGAGFTSVRVWQPVDIAETRALAGIKGTERVRVLEASTQPA